MKVITYCPVADELEMFKFSTEMAIKNAGIEHEFVAVVDSITSRDVMDYIKDRGFHFFKVRAKRRDWLYNLYACWNRGYDAFEELGADVVVPFGCDHAFYFKWLKLLIKYSKINRIVNCKLIESGRMPSIHECKDFGPPTHKDFMLSEFYNHCKSIFCDMLVTDEKEYGRRLDAMPFAVPKDVWFRFGPMSNTVVVSVTGDTDFFNRAKAGGVEIVKSLGSISYHYQKRG